MPAALARRGVTGRTRCPCPRALGCCRSIPVGMPGVQQDRGRVHWAPGVMAFHPLDFTSLQGPSCRGSLSVPKLPGWGAQAPGSAEVEGRGDEKPGALPEGIVWIGSQARGWPRSPMLSPCLVWALGSAPRPRLISKQGSGVLSTWRERVGMGR